MKAARATLSSPPLAAACIPDQTCDNDLSQSEGFSTVLEDSNLSQSSISEIMPQCDSDGYEASVNEPKHDFNQRFIESLCIDGDSDYDSESDIADDVHSHLPENNTTIMPSDCDIFDGSSLSVSASSLLVMQFKQRYQLTKEGLGDLLRLIRLHLPTPNKCPSSLYLFNKQFQEAKLSIIFHYFCTTCLQKLADNTISCCPNDACARDLTLDGGIASFIEVPVEQQLKVILERKYMTM